jgi:uncharacterized protein YvpB
MNNARLLTEKEKRRKRVSGLSHGWTGSPLDSDIVSFLSFFFFIYPNSLALLDFVKKTASFAKDNSGELLVAAAFALFLRSFANLPPH